MKRKYHQKISFFLAINLLVQTTFAVPLMALTGGPAQPEVGGFQPVGTTEMVDLFTGDFSYNIPLMDVDGYPINIAYNSSPTMDSEASWVGLGWSLNPGAVTRNLRGFPDDFKNEPIERAYNLKDDITVGLSVSPNIEVGGLFRIDAKAGLFYNTYRGFGREVGLSTAFQLSEKLEYPKFSLGLNYNTQQGIDVDAQASFNFLISSETGLFSKMKALSFLSLSSGFNSRSGLKVLSVKGGSGVSKKAGEKDPIGLQFGADFSFGDFTYFPTPSLPLANDGITFNAAFGPEVPPLIYPNHKLSGYIVRQYLKNKRIVQSAYGYFHHQDGQNDLKSLQDFNRSHDIAYREDMPNLSPAFGTYDLFNVTGQGISGQFRAARSDIGIFREPFSANPNSSATIGGELGAGGLFHQGFDINISQASQTSQFWKEGNLLKNELAFTSTDGIYNASYFRASGEKTITNKDYYDKIGNEKAVRTNISKSGLSTRANEKFEYAGGNYLNLNGVIQQTDRTKLNQVFSYLTAAEADVVALDKTIYSYPDSSTENSIQEQICSPFLTPISRIDEPGREEHHMSEVTVTQAGGSRYVYGIPAYNTLQKEVSFSVDPNYDDDNPDSDSELIKYISTDNPDTSDGIDNSTGNKKGKEHYFDAQTIPAYAHSFLLTGILSPDYVDRTGDGITSDDPGNAVKLNYSRFSANYKWRVPIEKDHARYQPGYASIKSDDKASYLYGKKEIWNLHRVESRTMIALFHTSSRNDALGVMGEDGGVSTTSTVQQLDSIQLFSKGINLYSGTDPAPIKTVHFEYDYSLCGGVPNQIISGAGKLTLKKIYFTYGNSQRGKLNAYKFNYNTENPDYNIGHYDRWGGYKQNVPSGGSFTNANYPASSFPSNKDFPYVLQDKTTTDNYAAAWSLNEIILPSGGKINVEYESDDYAYVQDKRAGQMFFIEGFSHIDNPNPMSDISDDLYIDADTPREYVIVKLSEPNVSGTLEELQQRYFADVGQLFFKCHLKLNDDDAQERKDYVQGYMQYKSVHPIGTDRMAIRIKKLKLESGDDIHPITLAGLQMMRLNLPELVYPGYEQGTATLEENPLSAGGIKTLMGFLNEVGNITRGFEQNSMRKGWAKEVECEKSWIRLSNPNYKKLGGGSRVKKLTISDEWNTLTNGVDDSNIYGQEYNYETTFKGKTISSGVASYEPFMGGEENLLRQPLPYTDAVLLAPDNYFYTETPIGKELYPAPVVGYSKVTVRNLAHDNVTRTATGYTINEYYTSKEFPVITRKTDKEPVVAKESPLASFFTFGQNEQVAVSQGFAIELNDMHGKMKSQTICSEKGSPISSTKYEYKTKPSSQTPLGKLDSKVNIVKKDGTILSGTQAVEHGVEIDMWQYMQEDINKVQGGGIQQNVDSPGFPPFLWPGIYPSVQNSEKRFRAAVTTKLIKRTGILDKVIVTENGSTLTTENVLFDSETGQVLLSKTQNEFDDAIYQFTYPAHWAYEGMEQAYQNIGAVFHTNLTGFTSSVIGDSAVIPFLQDGDEVIAYKDDGTVGRYFVTRSSSELYSGYFILRDANGDDIYNDGGDHPVTIKIIRSGHRNQAITPIASVVSRQNPVAGSSIQFDATTEVLEASAITFNSTWQLNCERADSILDVSNVVVSNPYPDGLRGNWRPRESFVFYGDRDAVNTQTGGTIQSFFPFWEYDNSTQDWQTPLERSEPNANLWTRTNTVTRYDDRGNELENVDAIGVHSAAYFGYDDNRVTAIASNAKRSEISFEGFEDYFFLTECYDSPSLTDELQAILNRKNISFAWIGNTDLSLDAAHTGKFSLKIFNDESFENIIDMRCEEYTLNPTIFDRVPDDEECYYCAPQLYMEEGKEYWMSIWVASEQSIDYGAIPKDAIDIELSFPSSILTPPTTTAATFDFVPEGPVIDGWQKMVLKFEMPDLDDTYTSPTSNITIPFNLNFNHIAGANQGAVYIDDFRFHPFLSNMKSYVYDPNSLRLLADLDENNYATFYEYDDEGILIRVKRETEKGIVTVQESRTTLRANNN